MVSAARKPVISPKSPVLVFLSPVCLPACLLNVKTKRLTWKTHRASWYSLVGHLDSSQHRRLARRRWNRRYSCSMMLLRTAQKCPTVAARLKSHLASQPARQQLKLPRIPGIQTYTHHESSTEQELQLPLQQSTSKQDQNAPLRVTAVDRITTLIQAIVHTLQCLYIRSSWLASCSQSVSLNVHFDSVYSGGGRGQ